ncbi:Alginate lyase [Opitutaceae bacterium TAV1]|nr:Alginate lyase [Opitutaceae bacterium TAV1]
MPKRCFTSLPVSGNFFLIASVFVFAVTGAKAAPSSASETALPALPRLFAWPAQPLVAAKADIDAGGKTLLPALGKLRADADRVLKRKVESVLDKTEIPESGDKHDYLSIGPYWWPDPKKPDGLPWIRRDGQVNREGRSAGDSDAFFRLSDSVWTLALAWYLTDHAPYAEQAAKITRIWFLDPGTRMNPDLEYAQAVPGVSKGRDIGIIDSVILINLTDGLALLENSAAWTAEDRDGMHAWVSRYLDWLLSSKNGRSEQKQLNNHGTWYDTQVVQFALVTGRTRLARDTLLKARSARLLAQVLPDGRQLRELDRTSPLHYSAYNARALLTLAFQATHVGLGPEWWTSLESGETAPRLRKALEFISPYASPQVHWVSSNGKGDNQENARAPIRQLLGLATAHYTDASFRKLSDPPAVRNDASNNTPNLPWPEERWQFFVTR